MGYVPRKRRKKKYVEPEKPQGELHADVHRRYIFGEHVADYLREIEGDPSTNPVQFSQYIKAGIKADDLEELYEDAHAQIRADPFKGKKKREKFKGPSYKKRRKTLSERRSRVRQIKAAFTERLTADLAAAQ